MRATIAALFLTALLPPASTAEQATRVDEGNGRLSPGEHLGNEGGELLSEFKHSLGGAFEAEDREELISEFKHAIGGEFEPDGRGEVAETSLHPTPQHHRQRFRGESRRAVERPQEPMRVARSARDRGGVQAREQQSVRVKDNELEGVRELVARVDAGAAAVQQCHEQRLEADKAAVRAGEAEAATKRVLSKERQQLRAVMNEDRRRAQEVKRMAAAIKAFRSKLHREDKHTSPPSVEDVGSCHAELGEARRELESRGAEVRAAAKEITSLKAKLDAALQQIRTFSVESGTWVHREAQEVQEADHKVHNAELELASLKAKATESKKVDASRSDFDSLEVAVDVAAFHALNQTRNELAAAQAKSAALEEAENQALKALGLQKNFDALQLSAAHKALNDTRAELAAVKSRAAALKEAEEQAQRMLGLKKEVEALQVQAALHALNSTKAELAEVEANMTALKERDARAHGESQLRADFDAMEVHATERVLNGTQTELLATKAIAASQKRAFDHTMNRTFKDLAFARADAEAFKEADARAMKVFGLESDFDHLEVHAEDALLNHTRAELAKARTSASAAAKVDVLALKRMHDDLTALEKADHWAHQQLGLHSNLTTLELHADATILTRTQAELSAVKSYAADNTQILNATQEQLDTERAHGEALKEADALARRIFGLHSDLVSLELHADATLLNRTQTELAVTKAGAEVTRKQLATEKAHEDALEAANAWAKKQFGLHSNLTALELHAYSKILNKTRADLAFANGNAKEIKEARDWLNEQVDLKNKGAALLSAELGAARSELVTTQKTLLATQASLSAARAGQQAEADAFHAEADAQRIRVQLADSKTSASMRDGLLRKLTEASAEIAELNATHAELAGELGTTLQEFRATTTREVQDVVQLHGQIWEVDDELAADRSQLHAKARELSKAQVQLTSAAHNASLAGILHDQLNKADVTLSALRAELGARDMKLNKTEIALALAAKKSVELQEMRAKANATRAQLISLRRLLDNRSQEVSSTRARLNTAEGALSVTHQDLAKAVEAVKDLHEMSTRLGAAKIELNTFRVALRSRSQELDATRAKFEAARRIQRASAAAAGVEGEHLAALGAILFNKSSELRAAQTQVSSEAAKLKASQSQLSSTESQLREVNATHRKLALMKVADGMQVSKLRAQLQSLSAAHAQAVADAKSQAQMVAELQKRLSKVAQMAADDLAERDRDDYALGEKIRDNAEQIQAQAGNLSVAQASLQEAQSALAAEKSELAQVRASAASEEQRARLEHKEATLSNATLQALRSKFTEESSSSNARRAELVAEIEAEKKQVAAGRAELATLQAKEAATEGTARNLEGQISQAKVQVAKDVEALRTAREKQAHLKKKIGAKYGKVVRELVQAQHAESALEAKNKALEKEVGGNNVLLRHRHSHHLRAD